MKQASWSPDLAHQQIYDENQHGTPHGLVRSMVGSFAHLPRLSEQVQHALGDLTFRSYHGVFRSVNNGRRQLDHCKTLSPHGLGEMVFHEKSEKLKIAVTD